jgi:DMSO/TMAO reductase YedYZ molybdopterin-dependent catalytic subunit
MRPVDERALAATTKPDLFYHDTGELNAETPAHLLDDDITPVNRLFVRNTGTVAGGLPDIAQWTLRIDGCVRNARDWTLEELRRRFAPVTRIAVLECAGNGRAYFKDVDNVPPWRNGAVGCLAWTGARLADLLADCGLSPEAVYTGHYSPDTKGDGTGPALSRGLPIAKATSPETLVAYAMNGAALPLLHGGPLRIVAPGYPGSAWQKWLTRIAVRDREHDGARMTGLEYRLPRRPLRPGDPIDPGEFDVITDMPVRSIVTVPREGFTAFSDRPLAVRGHAWSGHVPVASVEVSFDGGRAWQEAKLAPAPDPFAWRRFEATLQKPVVGAVEIVARAHDENGRAQPLDSAPWNPRGYCNNVVHRVRGTVQ